MIPFESCVRCEVKSCRNILVSFAWCYFEDKLMRFVKKVFFVAIGSECAKEYTMFSLLSWLEIISFDRYLKPYFQCCNFRENGKMIQIIHDFENIVYSQRKLNVTAFMWRNYMRVLFSSLFFCWKVMSSIWLNADFIEQHFSNIL